jgi:hypothetical protein
MQATDRSFGFANSVQSSDRAARRHSVKSTPWVMTCSVRCSGYAVRTTQAIDKS